MTQQDNIIVYGDCIFNAAFISRCEIYVDYTQTMFSYTIGERTYKIPCKSREDGINLQSKVFEIMQTVANSKPNY